MATTSPLQAVPIPQNSDDVDVVGDLSGAVNYMEARLIMRFSSTGARDAAITSPASGMVCYITGDNRFYYYEGSAWRAGTFVRAGVLASRPSAGSTPEGTIYCATDGNDLFVQIGGSWSLLNGTAAHGDDHSDQSGQTWNGTEKTLITVTIDPDADSNRSVLITGHASIITTDDSTFTLKIDVNGVTKAIGRLCSNRATGGVDSCHLSAAINLAKGSTSGERTITLKAVRLGGSGTAATIANTGCGLSYLAAPRT